MNVSNLSDRMRGRAMATVACAALALPLAVPTVAQTPVNGGTLAVAREVGTLAVVAPHQMTTRKKVVLLVGAAALYYLYRHHQAAKAQAQGAAMAPAGQPIYYLSKNGRVYYRDTTARVHWVTPPTGGVQVPVDEAQGYRGLQGYAGGNTGETNLSRFAARSGGM